MIGNAINRAFMKKVQRGWDKWPKMYWAIDLHDVIIPGTYTKNNENRQFYPYAKCILQWLTKREDMCIILFTASHKNSIADIIEWLEGYDIRFNYINENPECVDNELCSFESKFYFDILLEDKAGFEPNDWEEVLDTLQELIEWPKKRSHEEF